MSQRKSRVLIIDDIIARVPELGVMATACDPIVAVVIAKPRLGTRQFLEVHG